MDDVQAYLNKNISTEHSVSNREDVSGDKNYPRRDDFKLSRNRKYDQQFFSMYQYRLSTLKDGVDNNALAKWGDGTRKVDGQVIKKKEKILDIRGGELCWVSGTVFSDLKYKLNILEDVDAGKDDVLPPFPKSYIRDDETWTVMIEDESGRAILNNDDFLKKNILVTGCIVAVLGIEIQAGIFEIFDIVYPVPAPQRPLSASNRVKGKVALISGLNIDNNITNDLKLELLKQYLAGELGLDEEKQSASQIADLIIVGNSVQPIKQDDSDETFISSNNYGSKNISKFNPESLTKFLHLIDDILASMPVTIMPGASDPAEICLPQ